MSSESWSYSYEILRTMLYFSREVFLVDRNKSLASQALCFYKCFSFHAAFGTDRFGKNYSDFPLDQNAPVLSLACSYPYGLAAGTELTNHQASVITWFEPFLFGYPNSLLTCFPGTHGIWDSHLCNTLKVIATMSPK